MITTRELSALRPEFRRLVDMWLKSMDKMGLVALITQTGRSSEDQSKLYAIGRTVIGKDPIPVIRPMGRIVTWAQAGQSAHQYGLALDFVVMDCGKPDWSGKGGLWDSAIQLAKGYGMESLRPKESAHLQYPNWQSLRGA